MIPPVWLHERATLRQLAPLCATLSLFAIFDVEERTLNPCRILLASLGLIFSAPAFSIDAAYRAKLERSGCTQASELKGCDINKTRAENAKAGFATPAPAPAGKCSTARGEIEKMVCEDAELGALDRKLSGVYAAALRKAANERPPVLKAEQRGWIKGRDECWKSADRQKCVMEAYRMRIAGLQARYRLIPASARASFYCNGDPRNEVSIVFFQTDPASLIAERGDSVSLMFQQPAASGTRYQGRNESFWEHQGEATLTWGYGAPAMRCEEKKEGLNKQSKPKQ